MERKTKKVADIDGKFIVIKRLNDDPEPFRVYHKSGRYSPTGYRVSREQVGKFKTLRDAVVYISGWIS